MKKKKTPLRMCVACNEMKPKIELTRIVKNNNIVSVDYTGRSNGRGAYICNVLQCVEKAIKQRKLERAFNTTIEDEVLQELFKKLEDN